MRSLTYVVLLLTLLFLGVFSSAQQTPATSVPNLIRYGGVLKDAQGAALPGTTQGITFAIYKQQEGGAPVWMETQNVTLDASGHYSVLLGTGRAEGLPADLFSAQEQRWLGVQVQGEAEQARVLLVSVPYALKAVEADKLAGHSASEFVTTDNLQTAVQQQLQQQNGAASAPTTTNTSRKSTNSGITSPTIDAATDFIDTTANQVVLVQQNGTGVALSASAPSNTAILGTSHAYAMPGVIAGVEAVTSIPTGYGLYARQISTTAPGVAPTALFAQSDSPYGAAIRAWAPYGSTRTYGIVAGAASIGGTAIQATETATSGATFGLIARVYSPAGTGALILNDAIGTITAPLISAQTTKGVQFSVDGSGNVNAAGTFTAGGNVNAASAYQIGSSKVLSIGSPPDNDLFLGVGVGASNTTGSENTFIGARAGQSNTIGLENTFSGFEAGSNTTTGSHNTFYGFVAGSSNYDGDYNTFIGNVAGNGSVLGSNNSFFGNRAGDNNYSGSSDIYIGNEGPSPGTESNAIRIGTQGTGVGQQKIAFIAGIYGSTSSGGVPVYVNSSGQLGTLTSSLRFKEQVRDMGDSTNALMKLRPVTFLYKPEYDKGQRTLQYGLIAEEVAEVYPDLVAYEPDGKPYTVKYQYLTTMLLNELQKQHAVVAAQRGEIDSLRNELRQQRAEFQERLTSLEGLIGRALNAPQTESQQAQAQPSTGFQ
jgi:trimeric autotransporter adhesin